MKGAGMRRISKPEIQIAPEPFAAFSTVSRWRRRRSSERGLSLIEMLVTLAISVTVIAVVMTIIEEAMKMSLFVESHNDLAVMSQRPTNNIQKEVLQAKTIFGEDAIGTPYRTRIETLITAAGTADAPGSLLPIVNGAGVLAPDTGGARTTGNCLLVARQLTPVQISVAADLTYPVGTFPAITFMADRYQFEYFYLTRNTTRKFRGGDYSLDLYRYRSIPYADYFQLTGVTANLSPTQQTALATSIKAPAGGNLLIAWNPGLDLLNSFYTIDANLAFPAGSLLTVSTSLLAMQDNISLLPELLKGRISGKMDYTVAYKIGTAPGTNIPGLSGLNPVPLYFETAGATTPLDCGFEVKVVGPQGSRRVLTRLVLYSNYGVSKFGSQEGFVITSG
jgi:Prokaryotic N-terminal methylation motif